MRIQKRGIEPMSVRTTECGFYTEADLSKIIRDAFQEVMMTFMESEESQNDSTATPVDADKKLTLSVQEAAELIGVSKPTMFDLLYTGEIRYKKIGRKIIVSYQAIVDWINQ